MDKELDSILDRYRKKIEDHVDKNSIGQAKDSFDENFSKEYKTFRSESVSSKRSRYEEWCNKSERIIRFEPPKKLLPKIQEAIETAHINITPVGAASFAAIVSFLLIGFALIIGLISNISLITALINSSSISQVDTSLTLPFLLLILGLVALNVLTKVPIYIATRWRLNAGNQMVLCILYVIIYMRHTSNLENAIRFASQHLGSPLSLDLRKVFWDVEVGKYATIKESIDNYLQKWRKYNLEFVTAFHLIESSLYEPTESRRIDLLEKALKVMLDSTYEKMMHYAQEIKGPITTLHMLGIILPILGLVVFPLVGTFLGGFIKWYHLAILYNVILPVLVYTVGINILSKRPTGYQSSTASKEILKDDSHYLFVSVLIAIFFIMIGLIPIILFYSTPNPASADLSLKLSDTLNFDFLGYTEGVKQGDYYGPFGLGALIFSFFIPLGLAFAIGYYYKKKSEGLIEIRNETKKLELEFSSALFQLGNRIGDGVPAEIAFNKVAATLEDTPSGRFFRIVDINLRNLGMGLKEAIFNPKTGAILAYPSPLVETSMEVLLEGSAKGPKVTSTSLLSISTYIEKIHRVDERLRDLLAEIVSSMKTQTSFLTPAIAAIVVGVSSMVVAILTNLHNLFTQQMANASAEEMTQGLNTILQMFPIEGIIPGYYFQLIVGLYVLEIAIVLIILQNGIENSSDPIFRNALLGKHVLRSTVIYTLVAVIVIILFNTLVAGVIQSQIVP